MSNLVKSNLNTQITNLTPIEIALGIDEEGRTTARKLYEFLELDMSNYSKWTKRKILENEFAVEKVDFTPFVLNDERNPNPTTDYKLSASFAKKLAMGTHNAKGEAAKNYFVKVEDKLKENTLNTSELSPELQMFNKMFQAVAKVELSTKELKGEVQAVKTGIEETKEEIQGIRDIVAINSADWKEDCRKLVIKIANKLGGFNHIQDVYKEIYSVIEKRLGVQLNARLTNKRRRMADEGVCKSKRDKLNFISVIEDDKKLIEGYVAITKELAIKYGV